MHSPVHKLGIVGAAATLLVASACQSLNTKKEQGAVIGATGGAVVGGVIGHATGSTARGAIIGAAVGGAAGAIIGHQMDQKAKEIQAKVPGAIVTREGEGLVVTFASGLLFDFDSDRLRAESRRNLDSLATSLASFGDSKLLLVGHTDSVGTASYNLDLSQRRAGAVADYLISRGVPAARLATSGRGETDPVAPNDTDADRQLNRRVEVVVTAGDKMKAQAKAQAGSGS
ncbi:MAG TPA: OmpA family protein [Alphaproteobacteria bacterium]|jgi:outer membrane protein OmpA-like peptidoglycan-associated protein|nr:OmpA family protein [Alphaproteobacteria bacterium]